MLRFTTAALLCLMLTTPAWSVIPCWKVKAAVAVEGVAGAAALAKRHGYTDTEIAEARKCLK